MKPIVEARAHLTRGNLKAAEHAISPLLNSQAVPAEALQLAGLIHLQTGRFPTAATLLVEACKKRPDCRQTRFNLGAALAQSGRLTEGLDAFEHCLAQAPDDPDLLNAAGNCRRLLGSTEEAIGYLQKGLQIAPGHPGLLENLGWLRLREQPAEAARLFDRAIQHDGPSLGRARGKAEALIALNQFDEAEKILRGLRARFPENADIANSLGALATKQRHPEHAKACFEAALQLHAEHPLALLNLGVMYEQQGDTDRALALFQRTLATGKATPDALFHLAFLKGVNLPETVGPAIEQALGNLQPGHDRNQMLFAAARLADRAGRYEKAMSLALEARGWLAGRRPYPEQEVRDRVAAIERLKVPEVLRHAGQQAITFVSGPPRSGTTLTDQILASHPQVTALGETGFAASIANLLLEGRLAAAQQAIEKFLNTAQVAAPFTVETSPGNLQYFSLLARLFPQARFVICQRSPLDNCVSLLQHPLSSAHDYANCPQTLKHYFADEQAMARSLMDKYPDRVICQRYESLVQRPATEIPALLEKLEIPFHSNCLNPHETRRQVRTPSAGEVRQVINTDSIGRWRRYAKSLAPFKEQLEDLEAAYWQATS